MSAEFKDKEKIVAAINQKIPQLECPACKQKNFALGVGYFAHDLQYDLLSRQMGGINIPTVPLICSNCGFVAQFAAGILGLLPPKEGGS